MSNTPQKICFRYDGSDKANKAIGLINNKFARGYSGIVDRLYDSDGFYWEPSEQRPEMTLVTPAEFIRLMKGDEWKPKYGEEVEVSDNGDDWYKHIFVGKNPLEDSQYPFIIVTQSDVSGNFKFIRPIRKSLREEVRELIRQYDSDLITEETLNFSIIQLIKERGVEG